MNSAQLMRRQSQRRVQRVRYEIRRREVQVVRIEQPSPHFVSITFGGDTLTDFVSGSFDDHIKFVFDAGGSEPVMRDYTPRRFDRTAGELTIEFALHGNGIACSWARQARVGQTATIAGPRGSMIVPSDYEWHLLMGDATALPAIHRRLEELPADTRAHVVVELAHASDRRDLRSAAQLQVQWVQSADELVAAVQQLALPSGEGFAWAAGEAATMARIRTLLAEEKDLPKEAMRIAAYWRHGIADYHDELT